MTPHETSWPYDPSLPVASHRPYSSILASFPWQWEGFISTPQNLIQFAAKIPEFRHFIESLHRFESRLFKLGAGQPISDILGVLGLEIYFPPSISEGPPSFLSRHRKELTSQDFQNLASVIGAYSFFEVLALRENVIVRKPSPSLPTMYLPPSKTKTQAELHGWSELLDWINVLLNFRKIMGKVSGRDQMVTMKSNDSLTTLLRMLNSSHTNNDYHKIENNILYAALHVNVMKSIVFAEDQVPDLPKDILKRRYDLNVDAEAAHAAECSSQHQDTSVVEELRSANNASPAMMRNALHVSEILTPLFLLLPKQLVKLSFHRRTLLELAVKLRPRKSELMLRVEGIIWDAVFTLSRGTVTPFEALQELVQGLPWEELEAALVLGHAYLLFADVSDAPTMTKPSMLTTPVAPNLSSSNYTDACNEASEVTTPLRASMSLHPTLSDVSVKARQIGTSDSPLCHPGLSMSGPELSVRDRELGDSEQRLLRFINPTEESDGQIHSGSGEPLESSVSVRPRSSSVYDKTMPQAIALEIDCGQQPIDPQNVDESRRSTGLTQPIVSLDTGASENSSSESRVEVLHGLVEIIDGKVKTWTRNRTASVEDVDDDDDDDVELPARSLQRPENLIDMILVSARPRSSSVYDKTMPQATALEIDYGQQSIDPQNVDESRRSTSLTQPIVSLDTGASENSSSESRVEVLHGLVEIIDGKVKTWTRNRTASVEDVDDDDDVELPARLACLPQLDSRDFEACSRDPVSDLSADGKTKRSKFHRRHYPVPNARNAIDTARVINDAKGITSKSSAVLVEQGSNESGGDQALESDLSDLPSEKSDGEQSEVQQSGLSTGSKRKKRKARSAKGVSKIPGQNAAVEVIKRPSRSNAHRKAGPLTTEKSSKLAVVKIPLKRLRDGEGDSADHPIDVDQFHSIFEPSVVREFVWPKKINFKASTPPSRVQSEDTFVAWDANGAVTSFAPEAHHDIFLHNFKTFMDRAKTDYVRNLPKFLSEPNESCLVITDYTSFNAMDALAQQNMLADKSAAIIQNWPVDGSLKFDAKGLRTLTACFTAPLDLLDYSLKSASSGEPVLVTGKAIDLLENTEPGGKILNGLDFPKWNSHLDSNALTTDIAAWEHTRGLYFSDDRGASYPGSDMNWSLGALQWAITNLHIDADGAFTKNLVACGKKGWGFIKDTRNVKLSSINFFHDPGFDLHKVLPVSQYDIEFIILNPGDMLLMRPNTPHFVITLDHSICYGGHLFPTVTMQHTLAGLIHTFVGDRYLSNAAHHPSRVLLRRILVFYHMGIMEGNIPEDDINAPHLPNYHTIDGLLNLLSVCVLVIMGNVLDFRTYSAPNQYDDTEADKRLRDLMDRIDLNKIPENERRAICYARGVASHIMDWVRTCCVVTKSSGQVVKDFPSRFFVQIARSTLNYKKQAQQLQLNGAPHCTFERVDRQLANVIASDSRLATMWDKGRDIPSKSLELEDKTSYTVKWMTGWEKQWRDCDIDFFSTGLTAFDKTYFASHAEWCQFQASEILPKLGSLPKSRPTKKAKLS